MKAHSLLLSCLAAFPVLGLAQAANDQPSGYNEASEVMPFVPTARQADVIVASKESEKQQEQAEREARRVRFEVRTSKEVESGGRKVTFNLVAPPTQAELENQVIRKEAPKPSAKDLAEETRRADLQQELFTLSATTYDREVTHLRWIHDGKTYTAWSNVDFNYLRGLLELEQDGVLYTINMGFGNELTPEKAYQQLPEKLRSEYQGKFESPVPALPEFTPGRAEYVVFLNEGQQQPGPEVFTVIDALHAYYEANAPRLHAQEQRTEALEKAQKRYEAAHPETPKDVTINFWPKKNAASGH